MLSIQINGQDKQVDVSPDMPLLWVLRDELGLTGTKFGCGAALCGACTVHMDGQAIRACITPVSAAQGRSITTVEGVAGDAVGSAVQRAWVDNNVAQCGYCQAGQIMSTVSLLRNNAKPSDDEIRQALEGNICRCGTYPRIHKAVRDAADQLAEVK